MSETFKTVTEMPADGRGRSLGPPQHYLDMLKHFEKNPDKIIVLEGNQGRNAYFWFKRHPEHNVSPHKRGGEWYFKVEGSKSRYEED